jgi:AmmeMemoRadiSam system protein A
MNPYTALAKSAIESYIKDQKTIDPPKDLPSEFLLKKAGAFVTILENDNLKGCIGTYLPARENIAQEIIHNAIAAATEDYRFNSVTENDLDNLSYEVYILEKPQLIKNVSELDPIKYGVLVKSNTGKSGLLLPDLEGLDTTEKQLQAVYIKAGINSELENIEIYKFEAKKY